MTKLSRIKDIKRSSTHDTSGPLPWTENSPHEKMREAKIFLAYAPPVSTADAGLQIQALGSTAQPCAGQRFPKREGRRHIHSGNCDLPSRAPRTNGSLWINSSGF
jgi:hypothetical protein